MHKQDRVMQLIIQGHVYQTLALMNTTLEREINTPCRQDHDMSSQDIRSLWLVSSLITRNTSITNTRMDFESWILDPLSIRPPNVAVLRYQ